MEVSLDWMIAFKIIPNDDSEENLKALPVTGC